MCIFGLKLLAFSCLCGTSVTDINVERRNEWWCTDYLKFRYTPPRRALPKQYSTGTFGEFITAPALSFFFCFFFFFFFFAERMHFIYILSSNACGRKVAALEYQNYLSMTSPFWLTYNFIYVFYLETCAVQFIHARYFRTVELFLFVGKVFSPRTYKQELPITSALLN